MAVLLFVQCANHETALTQGKEFFRQEKDFSETDKLVLLNGEFSDFEQGSVYFHLACI